LPSLRRDPRDIDKRDRRRQGGNWLSRNEWYRPVDAYYAPQNALLTILMLTGLDGVTKPALQARQGKWRRARMLI
jgi:hypothetical protein